MLSLKTELKKNSSVNAQLYIKDRKDQLSLIQKNLNSINDAFVNFALNTPVNQYSNVNSEQSFQKSILDAINDINDKLRKISKDLSEIPEK